jgi:hypothetical protein
MHRTKRWNRLLRVPLQAAVVIAIVAIPSAAALEHREAPKGFLAHVSQSVAAHYFAKHPADAPAQIAGSLSEADDRQEHGSHANGGSCAPNGGNGVFNCDTIGFPQNEESTAACPTNDSYVLMGANDYSGLIESPVGDSTGWYWSTDGGRSVRASGYLPPASFRTMNQPDAPSGGDPVDFIPAGCNALYAASLVYDPATVPFGPNGVAVYRTTPATLNSCGGGDNPGCWPVKRMVAESGGSVFIDKEWMFVGTQNGVRYVWVTWSAFVQDASAPLGYTSVSIQAARCDEMLTTCSAPIPISTVDQDVQFSDVTVGPDGRTYITWAGIEGELPGNPNGTPGQPETFVIKERTETAPGSMTFGPEHVVHVEDNAIPFAGFLQANDFRIATYPKSDVVLVNGKPRIFVIWDACKYRLPFDRTCQEPLIKLKYSLDPDGATWSPVQVLSSGGVNYFPTISADRSYRSNRIAAAWFTNHYDPAFENAQDVVATSIDPETGQARALKRLTPASNEPEADPLLGGFFIGDYIEGVLTAGRYYVGYNANYRKAKILGTFGPPYSNSASVNQQDNYLSVVNGGGGDNH